MSPLLKSLGAASSRRASISVRPKSRSKKSATSQPFTRSICVPVMSCRVALADFLSNCEDHWVLVELEVSSDCVREFSFPSSAFKAHRFFEPRGRMSQERGRFFAEVR